MAKDMISRFKVKAAPAPDAAPPDANDAVQNQPAAAPPPAAAAAAPPAEEPATPPARGGTGRGKGGGARSGKIG